MKNIYNNTSDFYYKLNYFLKYISKISSKHVLYRHIIELIKVIQNDESLDCGVVKAARSESRKKE